jgi:hypothetical protein
MVADDGRQFQFGMQDRGQHEQEQEQQKEGEFVPA